MKNILVPISFSEASKNALRNASMITKTYPSSLTLLHCFPVHEYNRKYDFGKQDYDLGVRQMLLKFYKDTLDQKERDKLKLLTFPGHVSEIVGKISSTYQLLVMSRRTEFHSQSNNWFSDKLFFLSVKSLCPVLIVPQKEEYFSFPNVKNIWHINRKSNESDLINKVLPNFGLEPSRVISKSPQQKSFTSVFWRNIVNYSKNHNKALLNEISESYKEEKIDLLVLINHRKGMFEHFLKDDVFQIISQFSIPILILQSKKEDQ